MVTSLAARLRSLWRGLRRRSDVEAEMTEEFRLHLELRTADLVRSGLSRAEAARQARLEFGHAESYKQEGRESRGLKPFDELRVSWLDIKLGLRMLVKYPGLTLIGGLGRALAVAIGAGFFVIMTAIFSGLPLDEGERVVAIETWDTEVNRRDGRILHDFVTWRDELKSVEDLGAFRNNARNLVAPDGPAEPVTVAEMTAAGFRVARVPPLLGRPLVEEDEQEGAPLVIVIGYDVWRTRFASDPAAGGRRLSRDPRATSTPHQPLYGRVQRKRRDLVVPPHAPPLHHAPCRDLHERRDSGLRPDGHPPGRDRRAQRSGSEPPSHRHAALCRGARALGRCGGGRARGRRGDPPAGGLLHRWGGKRGSLLDALRPLPGHRGF